MQLCPVLDRYNDRKIRKRIEWLLIFKKFIHVRDAVCVFTKEGSNALKKPFVILF